MPVINENEMVCPYCGFTDQNSWEFSSLEDTQRTNCKRCDKEFYFEKTINVIFTTYPLEENKNEVKNVNNEK